MSDRYVEVAIDAVGAGGNRTYTYHVPEALGDLALGEAVLVDFGRRQALGLVMAAGVRPGSLETKPIRARVRSDGPLLPPLQVALAREIALRYLAPPALAIRAMLPPGLLERLELRARLAPSGRPLPGADAGGGERAGAGHDELARTLLEQLERAGETDVAVRDLHGGRSGAETVRSLRQLERSGAVELFWSLTTAGAGPRFERRLALTPAGMEAIRALRDGIRPPGRPFGPRQVALLTEMGRAEADAAQAGSPGPDAQGRGWPAAELAASYGRAAVRGLVARGLAELTTVALERRPLRARPEGARGTLPPDAPLTSAQRAAAASITSACGARQARVFLLDGVTGSGKTAVYARAIAAALGAGRDALVLVPEIALAVPLIDKLRAELRVPVALLHGALGEGERADEWRRIRAREVRVVVGTRSAVLAPLADPGVIIVDEEHDAAYKSDRTPRIQARDVAIELGRLAGAPVVLGSATPDVATVGRAARGEIERFALDERPAGTLPQVEVIDLRAELAAGNRGLLSRALARGLDDLAGRPGERAILLINRRGAASVVLCRDCGYVQACPDCQRPLVYHAAASALRCHHCGAAAPLARRCPACGSARIRYLGGGTERLEREVCSRFPSLRVGRLDRDVALRRGAAVRVLDAFRDGRLDVLVGTSLVAKGLDVPEVTLVGVVSADIALSLPDARAAERTYQLLAQAVGRAGRGDRPGRAIIQTYHPAHPAIVAVARHDAAAFYEAELAERAAFGFPPYGRLVKLTVADDDRDGAEGAARRMAERLRERAAANAGVTEGEDAIEVLGPVPAFVARRAGRWRFHVILRGTAPLRVLEGDPGPPWSVDVDPETLL